MKKIYVLIFLIFGTVGVFSQSLYEDFNYTIGTNIGGNTALPGTTNNNWTTHSNSQVGTINVLSGSLSYAGLQASTGNKVGIPGTNAIVPRDVNRNAGLGATNSVVYFSFLLNIVNGTPLGATHGTNGYFMHFGTVSGASAGSFFGRVSARTSGAGFRLGIADFANTFTDWGSDLSFGTTYLVVIKYDLVGTATADIASLWVNPAALGGAEPGGSITNSFSAGDVATNISNTASIAIRNSSATPNAEIDEIRVGTTWAQVTPAAGGPTINVSPTTLTGFTAFSGVPTAEQFYTVDGSSLTADIIITPPVGFEITTTSGSGYVVNPGTITLTQLSGTVASTPIYVRMNSATLGTNSGNITHTSAGSNDPNVGLTGHVITTEPLVQGAITIPAPTVTTNSMVVNFTSGDGAKRILVARSGSAVNSDPVDGTTYTANANFTSGTQIGVGNYVVYAGTGNTVTVTGLSPTTTYHFAVYEYNDAGIAGAENYLTTLPGTGNATTLSTDGDYRSIVAIGDWSNIATWQTRVANVWVAAVTPPLPTSNVYIQAAHTVTVDVPIATCNDLHFSNAPGILAIGGNTIEVNGKLRVYVGAAVTALGADGTFYSGQVSTATVPNNIITSTAGIGKMQVVGNTRVFVATGEWGNNPPGWDVEFAPTAGQTLTIQTGFKAANITVASGTVLSTNADIRPDGGGAGLGSLTVKSGAALQFSNNFITIQRVAGANGNSHFATLTVEAGAVLEFSGTSSPIIGAAAFALNGTVVYSGAGNQSLAAKGGNSGAVDPNTYTNLTFSGGGNKTLPFAVTNNGILNLISSIVVSTATNLLTMGATSSVTGASNASFVNGPVSKIGNTDFIFPVGKPNCGPSATVNGYVPIGISNFIGGAPTDQFTAEYIRASGFALPGGITALGLIKVSACEYWNLDKIAGSPAVDVRLYWNEPINNCTTASPYINNLADLVVAHNNGASWDTYGATLTATGTAASGDVTWPGASVFSPFTIGSVGFTNPLPITINYFNGTRNNSNHLLNWKVTCVSTPNATIEMERSTNGRNYSSIYSIFATALRCQQPFDYTDNAPAKGVNYYRLKMTDADGKITYSTTVTLINAVKGMDIMSIAPNPIVNGAFNVKISTAEKTQMELVITDMQGRVLQMQRVSLIAGFNAIPMNVKNLAAGTYQLYGNTADGRTRVLRFVVQ